MLGHIGGNGWMFPWGQHALLPGHDDGAVAHHSAGGYVSFTGTGSPNGPILFTGRFETLDSGPQGTWVYASPPAGVVTPPAAFWGGPVD